MLKRIFAVLFVFLLGALGGLWAQAFLLPYLAAHPSFQELQFVQDWNARTTVVNQISQILVNQDDAIERGIQRAKNVVVGVRSTAGTAGSGFIVTSDGLIVTWASFVPQGSVVAVFLEDGTEYKAQVLKRNLVNNLALLKIERTNLHTTGFVDAQSIQLGSPVFLVGMLFGIDDVQATANQGIVTLFNEGIVQTNILEKSVLDGSPLFDIEGRVVGLSFQNREGRMSAISAQVLRDFLGF